MANVWEDLRERLDQMSTGYPSTETGIELEIPEDELCEPPETHLDLMVELAKERGVL